MKIKRSINIILSDEEEKIIKEFMDWIGSVICPRIDCCRECPFGAVCGEMESFKQRIVELLETNE